MTAQDWRTTLEAEAFNQGRADYEADKDVWQNRYADAAQPDEAAAWREGWLAAAAKHERIADMDAKDKVLDGRRSL